MPPVTDVFNMTKAEAKEVLPVLRARLDEWLRAVKAKYDGFDDWIDDSVFGLQGVAARLYARGHEAMYDRGNDILTDYTAATFLANGPDKDNPRSTLWTL